jgi:protein NrfC
VQPVSNKEDREQKKGKTEISRRDFLKLTGTIIVGAGLGSCVYVIPVSGGYILVDPKKCQGCVSCMLACSLVHEGVENLSLSRIQVMQNSFEKWPDDLTIEQCRQCVTPACVQACPVGALEANADYGDIRMVDIAKCIGCGACVQACSYAPSRSVWNTEEKHAQTCDLCANTPYHWDEAGGGPDGKQACVEVCPVGAIKFTKEVPVQEGNSGYKVNLRGESWAKLGYPTD